MLPAREPRRDRDEFVRRELPRYFEDRRYALLDAVEIALGKLPPTDDADLAERRARLAALLRAAMSITEDHHFVWVTDDYALPLLLADARAHTREQFKP